MSSQHNFARPDLGREQRKGVPEVIMADRKAVEQSIAIAQAFLERTGRAILIRVPPALEKRLRSEFGPPLSVEWHAASRMAIVRSQRGEPKNSGGRVGVITAGTSDIPVAEEAALMCQEMGCTVTQVYDVGVAGLHRLFDPLERLLDENQVDVIIVAAGMDGALPSVVSGLVDVPVVGLPVSVGYGMGGKGEAALLSMLQSCSPGLAVVNIDNGIGAASMAALIANRMAAARRESSQN